MHALIVEGVIVRCPVCCRASPASNRAMHARRHTMHVERAIEQWELVIADAVAQVAPLCCLSHALPLMYNRSICLMHVC